MSDLSVLRAFAKQVSSTHEVFISCPYRGFQKSGRVRRSRVYRVSVRPRSANYMDVFAREFISGCDAIDWLRDVCKA